MNVANLLERISKFLDRWRVIIVSLGVISVAFAYASGFIELPARVEKLERRVDSSFTLIGRELDTIHGQLRVGSIGRDSINEKLELLLRINCPRVVRSDLVRPCQPYAGASRR